MKKGLPAVVSAAKRTDESVFRIWIWALPALAPVLLLLFSFILQSWWSWGLMDDRQLLELSGGIPQKIREAFRMYLAFGEFKPTFAAYAGAFYTFFQNAPAAFYVFKLMLGSAVLLIWGHAAARVTGRRACLFLLPAVALSFHYLYDAFFYLSSHEILGLLWTGLALECLVPVVRRPSNTAGAGRAWGWFAGGLICLLLAFGAKESFVACGMALGLSLFYPAWKSRDYRFAYLSKGLLLIAATVGYALALKFFVQGEYTSAYDPTDLAKMAGNFKVWLKKDLFNHLPWVALAGALAVAAGRARKPYYLSQKWGILLSVLLYGGFLLILLPWNTVSYYATPFGVFFAFGITLWLAASLPRVRAGYVAAAAVTALAFNLLVGQYALTRESAYQYDTRHLSGWIRQNDGFQRAVRQGRVFCNAMEPSAAIPGLIDRREDLGLKAFQWRRDPAGLSGEVYYVHSPRFHSVDLRKLEDWTPVFFSRTWRVYHKTGGPGGGGSSPADGRP